MAELLNLIIVFIASLIALAVLGLIAGFSPTLYIAQVAVAAKSAKGIAYSIAIMAGVVTAILLLIVLFQTIHLDTLLTFIDTSVRALTVSVIFNILVGGALIFGGTRYLHHREIPKPNPKKLKAKQAGDIAGIFGLGFARTFVSISGVTATYIAGNVIADVSQGIIERLIYTLLFLVATVVPFAVIIALMRKNPDSLTSITDKVRSWLHRFNYRLIGGVTAIIFGSSIVVINIMMALFY
jgi:cytochrome c biogenesis protein CcdA